MIKSMYSGVYGCTKEGYTRKGRFVFSLKSDYTTIHEISFSIWLAARTFSS